MCQRKKELNNESRGNDQEISVALLESNRVTYCRSQKREALVENHDQEKEKEKEKTARVDGKKTSLESKKGE